MGTWYHWDSTSDTTSSATTGTWTSWSSTSATVDTTGTASTWGNWCGNTTTSATSTDTWIVWDNAVIVDDSGSPEYVVARTKAPPKLDHIMAHYRRMQREINNIWRQHLADELKKEKEAAEQTAKALLLDLVSQKEFDLYEKTGRLLVKGRRKSYIVRKQGGVTIVHKKGEMEGMCVHLNYDDRNKCPETDNVIAMKVHIEQAEKAFLKTANRHGKRPARNDELEFLKAVNE